MLHLVFSPEPRDELVIKAVKKFTAIINVADSPCQLFSGWNIPQYWFPINEMGFWSYEPFYGAVKVCDQYNKLTENVFILVHCHAGVNRSQSMAAAIFKSYNAQNIPCQIDRVLFNGTVREVRGTELLDVFNQLQYNIDNGFVPENIIDFLNKRYEYPTYSIMGLLERLGGRIVNNQLPRKFLERHCDSSYYCDWVEEGIETIHKHFGKCVIVNPREGSKFVTVRWTEANSDYPSDVEKILLERPKNAN